MLEHRVYEICLHTKLTALSKVSILLEKIGLITGNINFLGLPLIIFTRHSIFSLLVLCFVNIISIFLHNIRNKKVA